MGIHSTIGGNSMIVIKHSTQQRKELSFDTILKISVVITLLLNLLVEFIL